jgi:hypothetical protein
MLRLSADENFSGDVVRGLLLRQPELDLIRVQDVGLARIADKDILAWAADNDRILLTHDRATMPTCGSERVSAGERMPGLFLINDRFPVGKAILEIRLLNSCSEQREWNGLVVYLPL